MKSGSGYIMTKLKIYIICKKANYHGMLDNIKVEDLFVKTGYTNFKNTRSAETGFQKTTQDVSTALTKHLTETKCENRASLLKILSCLRYLARQGLLLRGHGNNKDSNFKQLLNVRGEDDLTFA